MADITLKIEGMTCQHCVMSVRKAVESVKGVTSAEVTVGSAAVSYDDSRTDRDAIAKAVQEAGYRIVG